MSKDLDILRLKDDIEQAAKEIKYLQSIIDNLIYDQSSQDNTLSRMSIENNALQLERDDLKKVIQLADDGIADINSHWKQKFFSWRETEMQLLEEIDESKDKIEQVKSMYEKKIEKQTSEYKKLATLVDNCKDENEKLAISLQKSEEELKIVADKLLLESRNNIQNMFLSRENDILNEKVKVLENKVESFYDESIRNSIEINSIVGSHEPERDVNSNVTTLRSDQNDKMGNMKSSILMKETEIKNLKEELNRLSCFNESQNSRLKQLRKLISNANDTAEKSNSDLHKEKEKLKNANSLIDELKQKIVSVEKVSDNLESELTLKSTLLAEKDAKVDHFRNNANDSQARCEILMSEIESYKHTLNILQEEKNSLKTEQDSSMEKYNSVKKLSDDYSLQNKKLVEEIDCCNAKVISLSEKCKNSEVEHANLDTIIDQYKQNIINLEVTLSENKLYINTLTEETLIFKNDNKCLVENELLNTEIIANKNKCIEMLQNEMKMLDEKNIRKLEDLHQQLVHKSIEFKEYKKHMTLKNNIYDHNLSAISSLTTTLSPAKKVDCGILTEPETYSSKEAEKLRKDVAKLEKDLSCKDKKLCYAQVELSKQATEIVNNQCQIDQLNVKYAAMKARLNKDINNTLPHHIQNLNKEISLLNQQLVAKDNELKELRISESNIKHREQSLWELSELVSILQQELDSKHSEICKEVEFYKDRLMEYEKRAPTVNKSINTSIQDEISDSDSLCLKCDHEGKQVNLQDLEVVMTNLKATYHDDLNALHASFRDKISKIDDGICEVNDSQWINLMNK